MLKPETLFIYIVEDSRLFAESLKQYIRVRLENQKIPSVIKTFSTGENCINAIHNGLEKPAIVILDFHLNGKFTNAMNGLSTMFHIKQVSPATRIIFLSSQSKENIILQTLHYGAFDYIIKDREAFAHVFGAVRLCVHEMLSQEPGLEHNENMFILNEHNNQERRNK